LLQAARERGTSVSLVLDRVPPEAIDEIAAHLAEMLAERGLGDAPVLAVPESALENGRLPAGAVAAVRAWLDDLTADAQARAGVVRRTLTGALASLPGRGAVVRRALDEQLEATAALGEAVGGAYADALGEVDAAVRSGSLLRGEVLARWHDVVGTGDLMRALESGVGRLRDRVRSFVTGAPRADRELQVAVESGVESVVHTQADRAAERAGSAWRGHPAGRALLEAAGGDARLDAASADLGARTGAVARAWQASVFELVRAEAAGKRTSARIASLGVNGAGLAVMVAVFASTGGLTGAEVVVAGGTSAVSQRVLEAIFGDQAVRSLAARAREDLLTRVEALFADEAARFTQLLDAARPDPGAPARLGAALAAVAP
ncbi:MAG TPA: hypothetical protein VIL49_12815, partial [Capillimicrobium sp.]